MKAEVQKHLAALQTPEAAVNLAAGAITAVAVGATAYLGGKAALTTGAVVGGGLIATAVVFTSTKMLLNLSGAGIAMASRRLASIKLDGGRVAEAAG